MKLEFRVAESQYKAQIVDNETHKFIEYEYFPCYGIVMCKVDENGNVISKGSEFIQMSGGDLHELKVTLQEALEALSKPVIELGVK